MDPRHRDGLLALLALAGLGGVAVMAEVRVPLFHPAAAATGVVGALLLELAFLHSERLGRAWESSRTFRIGTLVLLFACGATLARVAGAWTLAALVWGLLAYLALLGTVLVGVRNPVTRLVQGGKQ